MNGQYMAMIEISPRLMSSPARRKSSRVRKATSVHTEIQYQARQLQNPVFTVELLLQEAGLGAAIAGKMRVLEAHIGRPECILRNVLDCCNGGLSYRKNSSPDLGRKLKD
jgi:hypothetical protein